MNTQYPATANFAKAGYVFLTIQVACRVLTDNLDSGTFIQTTVYAGMQVLTFYFKAAITEAIIISGISVKSLFEKNVKVIKSRGVGYGYQFSRTL